jgi:parallel beta-helix repeat protein
MRKLTLGSLGLVAWSAVCSFALMLELAGTRPSWASITCDWTTYYICGDAVNPYEETWDSDCPDWLLDIPCDCGDTVVSDTKLDPTFDNVTSSDSSDVCWGDGLDVESGVTLDCGSATLRGSGYGNGISVKYESYVTIKNCHVQTFGNGIYAKKSHHLTLNSVKSKFNYEDGAHFDNVTSSTVKASFLQDNGDDGIELDENDGNVVQGTRIERNAYGVYLNSAHNDQILNNQINNNLFEGVLAEGDSDGNTIANNVITGNNEGIKLTDDANGNTLSGNSTNNNFEEGIELEPGYWDSPDGNFILNNKAEKNGEEGIDIESSDNTVSGNKGQKNGDNGLEVDGGSGNELDNNNFGKNGGHGICTEVGTATNNGGNTGSGNLTPPNVIFGATSCDIP